MKALRKKEMREMQSLRALNGYELERKHVKVSGQFLQRHGRLTINISESLQRSDHQSL